MGDTGNILFCIGKHLIGNERYATVTGDKRGKRRQCKEEGQWICTAPSGVQFRDVYFRQQ